MPSISTCLIEKNIFFREGLKTLLAETDFRIEETYPDFSASNISDHAKSDAHLIILGTEDGEDDDSACMEEVIKSVKAAHPESRIAVMTANENSNYIASAFAAGADGYLMRNISPPALIGSLNMIMMGEKICPAAMLKLIVKREAEDKKNIPSPVSASNLSLREIQVLKHLAVGKSNKEIAKTLCIAEATVKVHIKAVLRKLGLANRTQAAVWTVNNGVIAEQTQDTCPYPRAGNA